ncbi:MAG TPA: glycogen synthase GlgA [Vicinamibacterales bacterium]|nr:glycogen synthase GlgA [Vicinamibacterales bacterium]
MAARSALVIGSEAVPFAKTGGLADVLGALPPAIARLGWDVTLVLPRYRDVTAGSLVDTFPVGVGGYTRDVGFFEAPLSRGARAILVDCPDLFDREELYAPRGTPGYPDNARRFAMLVRAALEWTARRSQRPSVVHGHDWQAGLAPVYLKTLYGSHPILGGVPSVFTIHNLAYQGLFEPDWLPRVDLGWEQLTVDRLEFWGRFSFLKGAIKDAAIITTVSRTYANEIQTPEFGFGFDGILRDRRNDLFGILNGIDTAEWDPRHDAFLPASFGPEALEGKLAAKRAVLARYALPDGGPAMTRPLVGMISRMVDQKGFDLIEQVAEDLSRLDATFVVLGTGDARYQDLWTKLAARHPLRIAAHIGFDEGLAHLIEGGADIFLMPSRFEPCGLNQMYSLRYGTLPVVRAVGGLADTVRNYSPADPDSTGFAFTDYTGQALLEALRRALALYREPGRWRAVQRAAMGEDNSWDHSAREYVTIYEKAIEAGVGG